MNSHCPKSNILWNIRENKYFPCMLVSTFADSLFIILILLPLIKNSDKVICMTEIHFSSTTLF